jgi:hypothetical protein
MIGEMHIVDREHERFADPQAVMIDQPKEGFVAGRLDCREEAFQLVLGEIFA